MASSPTTPDVAIELPAERVTLADFVDASSFWSPSYVAPSAWIEHASFAFWLIGRLRPRSFVELGTHYGYSYFAMCQAVQRHGTGTRCYAVDTWRGDEHTATYGEEVYQQVREENERLYAGFSRLVRSTFDDAAGHFSDGSVDLLHIDGTHFYADVRNDFDTWAPKLSERAVVLFHDTNVREREFGVHRLMEELARERPLFQFLHGHGLGVLKFGDAPLPGLDALFGLGPQDDVTQQVRDAYAVLGSAHALSQERDLELHQLRTVLGRKSDAVAELSRATDLLRAERDDLRTRLVAAETNRANGNVAALLARSPAARRTVRRLKAPVARPMRRIETSLRSLRPNPLFDAGWYLATYSDVGGGPSGAYRQYRREGWHAGRDPNPLFQTTWYLEHNPDVAASGQDPLEHYLQFGGIEGRDPSPRFNSAWYLQRYPSVAAAGVNPLLHYLRHGKAEGRRPLPPVDA